MADDAPMGESSVVRNPSGSVVAEVSEWRETSSGGALADVAQVPLGHRGSQQLSQIRLVLSEDSDGSNAKKRSTHSLLGADGEGATDVAGAPCPQLALPLIPLCPRPPTPANPPTDPIVAHTPA